MDTFGGFIGEMSETVGYRIAYEFCAETTALFGTVLMAMLGSIIYMRKQDAKRAERANELLATLIDKVEARTRAENG